MNLVMLKILGFVFMIIDHLGILFDLFPLRLIGRLSFPIFAFCVANGVVHTKNWKKYLLRLLLLAIVSEIPFDLFMFGKLSFETQNVFFTLLLGGICIIVVERLSEMLFIPVRQTFLMKNSFVLLIISAMLCGLVAFLMAVDYGCAGVYVIFFFYLYLQGAESFSFLLIYMLWRTFNGFGIIGALSLILIKLYDADKPFNKKLNRWLYIVYPVHLIILFVLRCLL